MNPKDIPAARGVNKLLGACVLPISFIFLLPVCASLYYDGFSEIPEWPLMFFGLACVGGGLLLLGVWLWFARQRVGAQVAFNNGGFSIQVRRFFRRDISVSVTWKEIEEMKIVEAPRGGDVLSFRLTHSAAVKHGLIQPTTRMNASKSLVRREIGFPIRLSAASINDAIARFQASAGQAGAKLVETASFNVVIFARKVWSVEWN